ncbi:hypothetical protein [Breznakiella homolactica]|nr:hypothetical protein [Breznakiella homolactica]
MPNTTFPSMGYAISMAGRGRMSLPVAPSSYIYSHFKNISGTPAPEGVQGVTITKLKVLDVLIEQLQQIKKNPGMSLDSADTMTDQQVDALIEQYENQIKQAQAANAVMPYNPRPSAPAGALFNLTA